MLQKVGISKIKHAAIIRPTAHIGCAMQYKYLANVH